MFDDPFFAQMHRESFGGLDSMFRAEFPADPFARQPAYCQAPPSRPAQSVTIEEVEDHDDLPARLSKPLVEEPDEGNNSRSASGRRHSRPQTYQREPINSRTYQNAPGLARASYGGQRQHHQPAPAYARPAQEAHQSRYIAAAGHSQPAANYGQNMVSYSSSFSYSSYGGPGGNSFSRTQSSSVGPGGVAEYSESYSDGRRQESSSQHSRFIGNRGRTVQRAQSSNGQATSQDILHNLQNGRAADGFEQDWAGRSQGMLGPHSYSHAWQALPGRRQ
ncbi:hypothetical protein WJX84_005500 [Apatococcus fuscideae]|uniref:Uncharacterized protein n=1 Tax=Apatococcus fuscideae TaxID=2026836 RepID=A0AAW1SYS5_9CHLO